MRPYTSKVKTKVNKKTVKTVKTVKNMKIMKNKMTAGEPLIEYVRNNMTESLHSGHLLILNKTGNIELSLGKHNFLIYPRSAIKAIQTSAMVRNGLNLPAELIALVCSSHIGTPMHQTKVKEILATVGLNESFLQNTPLPTSLASPCSGKHAGMLVTSEINGWSLENYKNPRHPVQKAIKKELELLSEERITKIAVDGCGAPLFALTLRGLARTIHNLMVSPDPVHQQVVNACRDYPVMVSGEGTLPTVAMQTVKGLFVKTGAESVLVAGLSNGYTIAWKISDGSERGEKELLTASLKKIGITANFSSSKKSEPQVLIRAVL